MISSVLAMHLTRLPFPSNDDSSCGPAEQSGLVQPGHHVIAVNGESTLKLSFKDTIQLLATTRRPVTVTFETVVGREASAGAALHSPSATKSSFDGGGYFSSSSPSRDDGGDAGERVDRLGGVEDA